MAVTVRIPSVLTGLTGGKQTVAIEAENIRSLLNGLDASYTGIGERLTDEQGEVRRFINLYVNEEDIRFLEGLNTDLQDGDKVSIVPAIAGG